MKEIDKVILEHEIKLARYKAEVKELIEGISKFNFYGSKSSSVTKKYCKFLILSLLLYTKLFICSYLHSRKVQKKVLSLINRKFKIIIIYKTVYCIFIAFNLLFQVELFTQT